MIKGHSGNLSPLQKLWRWSCHLVATRSTALAATRQEIWLTMERLESRIKKKKGQTISIKLSLRLESNTTMNSLSVWPWRTFGHVQLKQVQTCSSGRLIKPAPPKCGQRSFLSTSCFSPTTGAVEGCRESSFVREAEDLGVSAA